MNLFNGFISISNISTLLLVIFSVLLVGYLIGRITINLAPADIKKIGSLLDLPIAIGILMKSNQITMKKRLFDK